MKRFQLFMVLCLTCFLATACSEKQSITTGQAEPTKAPQQSASAVPAEETETQAMTPVASSAEREPVEIGGTLMQTEKGLAIVTDTQAYVVVGKDLSDMLGKTVTVTGALAEVDGGQVIEVMTVTPME